MSPRMCLVASATRIAASLIFLCAALSEGSLAAGEAVASMFLTAAVNSATPLNILFFSSGSESLENGAQSAMENEKGSL